MIAGREVYVIDVDERGTPKVKRLSAAAEVLGDDMRRAADGIERLEVSMRKGTRTTNAGTEALKRNKLSLLSLDAGLSIATKGFGLLQKSFNALKAPVALAASFETEIAAIDTITQSAGTRFRDQFLDISERTGQAAGDVARAAYEAVSAGVAQESAAQFVEVSNELARSGRAGLTESLELLATIREQFGLADGALNRVNSQIFLATRDGRTKVSELAADMGGLIPIAKSAGQSLEEMLGGIVSITKAGITTNTATTQLRAYAVAVQKNGANIAKALSKAGRAITETQFKSLALADQVSLLNTAFAGNEGALIKLFGRIDGVQAVQVLARNGAADLRAAVSASAAATDEAAVAVRRFASTGEAAFNRLKSTFSRQLIELGTRLMPLVNDGLRDLTQYLSSAEGQLAISEFAKSLKAVGEGLAVVAKAAASTVGALRGVGEWIGEAAARDYLRMERGVYALRDGYRDLTGTSESLSQALASVGKNLDRSLDGTRSFDSLRDAIKTALDSAGDLGRLDLARPAQETRGYVDSLALGAEGLTAAFGAFAPVGGVAVQTMIRVGSAAQSAVLPIFSMAKSLAVVTAQASGIPGAMVAAAAAIDQLLAQSNISGQSAGAATVARTADPKGQPGALAVDPFKGQGDALIKALLDQFKQAEAIQDRNDRNRLGAIENQSARELALLDLRFQQEARKAERSGDDLTALQGRQAREFTEAIRNEGERRARIESERRQLSASFEADEFTQRRLLLDIEREETLARVVDMGGSVIDATAAFERRRTEIMREESERRLRVLQSEVNAAGELAGNLITLGDAITGADSKQSALRIALEGAVLASKAVSAGAESGIEFARGNVFKGAALAAASAAAGIEAIKLGAKAAGLGGGSGSSAPSGNGRAESSGAVERAPAPQRQADSNRPVVIQAGMVVGEGGMRELAQILAPHADSHTNGRRGYIGERAS